MMEKFDKNSTYTVIDITTALMESTDRYQDFESARGAVNQMINKLGIQSVNGQKRNRYFTGMDAQKVLDALHGKPILSETSESKKTSSDSIFREFYVDKNPATKGKSGFISLNSKKYGPIDIRPEDISLITLPSLRFFLTFRGYGSLITLKNGKTLHINEEPQEVSRIIREFTEVRT